MEREGGMGSGAGNDGDERRKTPRARARLPIRFGTEARMVGAIAVDISDGGLRVETPETFPPSSILQVYVQFPQQTFRIRARVAWQGARQGGKPGMGLQFTQPERSLVRVYNEWLGQADPGAGGEAKDDSGGALAEPQAGSPSRATAARPARAAGSREPRGPVKRRLETKQGNSYDVLMAPQAGGWRLTIVQLPRQIGVGAPDLEETFPTFAAAEQALRAFIQGH
jgi:hypothetical protein